MAFIKIQDIVINTSYIAAVKLDSKTSSGEKSISILITTPNFSLFSWEFMSENVAHSQWIEFTGEAANVLRDYFSSCNNVIDLMPQCCEPLIVDS